MIFRPSDVCVNEESCEKMTELVIITKRPRINTLIVLICCKIKNINELTFTLEIYCIMRFTSFQLNIGSKLFKALSEEARIRILYLMYTNGEMCIADIEHILEFTQSKTSRHITYIKNSGLLNIEKHDQWVYYSIKEEYMSIIPQIFSYLEKDTIVSNDQETFETLYANNILAIRKLHNQQKVYKVMRK